MKITEKELRKMIKEALKKKMSSLKEGSDYTALRQITQAAENTSMSFEDEIVKLLNLYPPDQLPEPAQKLYHQIVSQLSDRFVQAVSDATTKLSKFKKRDEVDNVNESRKDLKKLFLEDNKPLSGEKEIEHVPSNGTKDSIDKLHTRRVDKQLSNFERIPNFVPTNELKEGEEFDKAWQEKEDDLDAPVPQKETEIPNKLNADEPFHDIKEDCDCSYAIEVEPEAEPLDTVEFVQLIFPSDEEVALVKKDDGFKPAGSPEFSNTEDNLMEDSEPSEEEGFDLDDDEEENEEDYLQNVLKDIEDEDFGKFDYSSSEEKPKGF